VSKQLIIAEKPSVAQDIARALGGFTKEKDFFESEHYVLSSAVGHLLELTLPEEFEVKRGKWSFANLPVIPPHFALKPVEKDRRPPEIADPTDQAQGCRWPDQRL
jgi:DNA topoisomerase III